MELMEVDGIDGSNLFLCSVFQFAFNLQFNLQAYQYYVGSGENAALGKCGPGGGLGILQESVASGGSGGVCSRV